MLTFFCLILPVVNGNRSVSCETIEFTQEVIRKPTDETAFTFAHLILQPF